VLSEDEYRKIAEQQQMPQSVSDISLTRINKNAPPPPAAAIRLTPIPDVESDDDEVMEIPHEITWRIEDTADVVYIGQRQLGEPEEIMSPQEWENLQKNAAEINELVSGMATLGHSTELTEAEKIIRLKEYSRRTSFNIHSHVFDTEEYATASDRMGEALRPIKLEMQDTRVSANVRRGEEIKNRPIMHTPMTIEPEAHHKAVQIKQEKTSPTKKPTGSKVPLREQQANADVEMHEEHQEEQPPQEPVSRKTVKRETLPEFYKNTVLIVEAEAPASDLEEDQVEEDDYSYERTHQFYWPEKNYFKPIEGLNDDKPAPKKGEPGHLANRKWIAAAGRYAPPEKARCIEEQKGSTKVLEPMIANAMRSSRGIDKTTELPNVAWCPTTDKPINTKDWNHPIDDAMVVTTKHVPRGMWAEAHDDTRTGYRAFNCSYERLNATYMTYIAQVLRDKEVLHINAPNEMKVWQQYGLPTNWSRQLAVVALIGKNFFILKQFIEHCPKKLPVEANTKITEAVTHISQVIVETARFEMNHHFIGSTDLSDNWQMHIDQLKMNDVPAMKMMPALVHNLLVARIPGEIDYNERHFVTPLENNYITDCSVLALYKMDRDGFQRTLLVTVQLAQALYCCLVATVQQNSEALAFWSPLMLRYRYELFGIIHTMRSANRLSTAIVPIPPLVKQRALPLIGIGALKTTPIELLSNAAVDAATRPGANPRNDHQIVLGRIFCREHLPPEEHLLWRNVPSASRPSFQGEDARWREGEDLHKYRKYVLETSIECRPANPFTQIVPEPAHPGMPIENSSEAEQRACNRMTTLTDFWTMKPDDIIRASHTAESYDEQSKLNLTLANRSRLDATLSMMALEELQRDCNYKPLTEYNFVEITALLGPVKLSSSNYKDGLAIDYSDQMDPTGPLHYIRRRPVELNAEKQRGHQHIQANNRVGLGVFRSPKTIADCRLRSKPKHQFLTMADINPPARRLMPVFKDPLHGMRYERAFKLTRELFMVHFLRIDGFESTDSIYEAKLVINAADIKNFSNTMIDYQEELMKLKFKYDELLSFFPEPADKDWNKLFDDVKESQERLAIWAFAFRECLRSAMTNASSPSVEKQKAKQQIWLTCPDEWCQATPTKERTTARIMLHHPMHQEAFNLHGRPNMPMAQPHDMDGNPVEMRNAGSYVSLHPDVLYNIPSSMNIDPLTFRAGLRGTVQPESVTPLYPLDEKNMWKCRACHAQMADVNAHRIYCPIVHSRYQNGSCRTFQEAVFQYADQRLDVIASHTRLQSELRTAEEEARQKALAERTATKKAEEEARKRILANWRIGVSKRSTATLKDIAYYGTTHIVFDQLKVAKDFTIPYASMYKPDKRAKLRVTPDLAGKKPWTPEWYHREINDFKVAHWQRDRLAYALEYSKEAELRRQTRLQSNGRAEIEHQMLHRYDNMAGMIKRYGYTDLIATAAEFRESDIAVERIDTLKEIAESAKLMAEIFKDKTSLTPQGQLTGGAANIRDTTMKEWQDSIARLHDDVMQIGTALQYANAGQNAQDAQVAEWTNVNMRSLLNGLLEDHATDIDTIRVIWRTMFMEMDNGLDAENFVRRVLTGIEISIDDSRVSYTKEALKWLMHHFIRSREEIAFLKKNVAYNLPHCFAAAWETMYHQRPDGEEDRQNFTFEDRAEAATTKLHLQPELPRMPNFAGAMSVETSLPPLASAMAAPAERRPKKGKPPHSRKPRPPTDQYKRRKRSEGSKRAHSHEERRDRHQSGGSSSSKRSRHDHKGSYQDPYRADHRSRETRQRTDDSKRRDRSAHKETEERGESKQPAVRTTEADHNVLVDQITEELRITVPTQKAVVAESQPQDAPMDSSSSSSSDSESSSDDAMEESSVQPPQQEQYQQVEAMQIENLPPETQMLYQQPPAYQPPEDQPTTSTLRVHIQSHEEIPEVPQQDTVRGRKSSRQASPRKRYSPEETLRQRQPSRSRRDSHPRRESQSRHGSHSRRDSHSRSRTESKDSRRPHRH